MTVTKKRGEEIAVYVNLENQGDLYLTDSNTTIRLEFVDSGYSTTETLGGVGGTLNPGSSKNLYWYFTVPQGIPYGTYDISLYIMYNPTYTDVGQADVTDAIQIIPGLMVNIAVLDIQ